MKVRLSRHAKKDLEDGYLFYEAQSPGVGRYFLDSLSSEIDSLQFYSPVYAKVYRNYRRLLAKRFPFAIYYRLVGDEVWIEAILHQRQDSDLRLRRRDQSAEGLN
ncbi:type II toxin-antitoxin system RelE/ParE family toxin [Nitratifractor sp.]